MKRLLLLFVLLGIIFPSYSQPKLYMDSAIVISMSSFIICETNEYVYLQDLSFADYVIYGTIVLTNSSEDTLFVLNNNFSIEQNNTKHRIFTHGFDTKIFFSYNHPLTILDDIIYISPHHTETLTMFAYGNFSSDFFMNIKNEEQYNQYELFLRKKCEFRRFIKKKCSLYMFNKQKDKLRVNIHKIVIPSCLTEINRFAEFTRPYIEYNYDAVFEN